eukprot:m.43689 g.43689  ORF g.43689 m.43689 type:complete len:458 (+) comp9995_c0_seq2:105-1478(+)
MDGGRKAPRQCRADYCKKDISNEIHIACVECKDFELCLPCFSVGAQEGEHFNYHNYRVIDNMKFPLFDPDWGADEEHKLLSAIAVNGFGNWEEVAAHVGSRAADECRQHYLDTYIKVKTAPIPDPSQLEVIRKRRKLEELEEDEEESESRPPSNLIVTAAKRSTSKGKKNNSKKGGKTIALAKREVEKQKSSAADDGTLYPPANLGHSVAGFYPRRKDFENEYDNDCERLISEIVFYDEDTPLDVKLKVAMLRIYNARLTQREKRKLLAVDYGLTDVKFRKMCEDEDFLGVSNVLKPFATYQTPAEHRDLLVALHERLLTVQRIKELKMYREDGLRQFSEISTYEIEKKRRARDPKKGTSPGKMKSGNVQRKTSILAAAESLPGMDLLCENEQLLCLEVHLLPQQYIWLKSTLISLSLRMDGVTLQQAKSMTPLPATQVEKIYKYLLSRDWIKETNA